VGRRLPVHPLDAAAAALAAEGNRAFALPLAKAIDRHRAWVLLLCGSAAALAALGVSLPASLSAALSFDLSSAVPAWARQAVTLATETGGAAELPWLGAVAATLAPPLAVWAVARCWWLGSSDACFLLQPNAARQEEGSGGARLLLAWALSAARFVMLSRAADACGAALAGLGAGAGAAASPLAAAAAALLAALALAPSAAAALGVTVVATNPQSSSNENNTANNRPSRAPAVAVLALELSWLGLRCAQAALSPLAPPLALSVFFGLALAASLYAVHSSSVLPRIDAARASRGDAVRVHLTARLAWDGFGAGAAFDGTGRKGLGMDLDDPDQASVPIVLQLPGGAEEGGGAGSTGRVLLFDDEAARLAAGAPPATPAGRLAPFGPALARALEGALPGERVVVRARIAGPGDEVEQEQGESRESDGASSSSSSSSATANPNPDAPARYFHPGLEALLTMTEARLLVYGRDLAREDPGVEPGDGLMLPIGGDGSGPRGAFQGLDGEIGATGRVPGVVLEVGRAGVRASGNAVLAGRNVELEARVETVLRGEERRPTLLV
jgi:hypothetical protein